MKISPILPLLICSVMLNVCLWAGFLVPQSQVAAIANQLAFSDPVAIIAGRE